MKITLAAGRLTRLCSTSSVHLSKDRSIADPASSALMMALDRGAIEANYAVGTYSDVLLTPDLRILISGPGQADLRIRVNPQGDTCVDNHGANAPYVTVTQPTRGRSLPGAARSARQLPAWQPAGSGGSRTGALRLPSNACHFRGQCRGYDGQPGAARTAGGWPFLYACGYGFPHRGKRGTGCASCSARRTGGSTRRNACPSDCSAHLQRRESCAPRPPAPPAPASGGSLLRRQPRPRAPRRLLRRSRAAPSASQGGFFHRIGHFFSKIFGK